MDVPASLLREEDNRDVHIYSEQADNHDWLATIRSRIQSIEKLTLHETESAVLEAIGLSCTANARRPHALKEFVLYTTGKLIQPRQIVDALQCIEQLPILVVYIERPDLLAALHVLADIDNCAQLIIRFDGQELVLDYAQQSLLTNDFASLALIEYTGKLLTFDSHQTHAFELLTGRLEKQAANYHMLHLRTEMMDHLRVLQKLWAARAIYRENGTVAGTFFRLGNHFAANILGAPHLAQYIPHDVRSLKVYHHGAGKPSVGRLLSLPFLTNLCVVDEFIDGHLTRFSIVAGDSSAAAGAAPGNDSDALSDIVSDVASDTVSDAASDAAPVNALEVIFDTASDAALDAAPEHVFHAALHGDFDDAPEADRLKFPAPENGSQAAGNDAEVAPDGASEAAHDAPAVAAFSNAAYSDSAGRSRPAPGVIVGSDFGNPFVEHRFGNPFGNPFGKPSGYLHDPHGDFHVDSGAAIDPFADVSDDGDITDYDMLPLALLKRLDASTHWQSLRTIQMPFAGVDQLKRLRKLLKLPSLEKITVTDMRVDVVLEAVRYCNEFHAKWTFEQMANGMIGKKVKCTSPTWALIRQQV